VRNPDRGVETGFACYPWFERDPMLEPLRRDPGSRALFDELKRRYEAARARYEGPTPGQGAG